MNLRNFTPPHLVEKPCRKCKRSVKALKNGVIQLHPTCAKCSAEEDKVFHLAQLAANRQARNKAHKVQATASK